MIRLGVNIDHVATLREARDGNEPDPVWAAAQAELGGADGITIHLREDRRHIQDRDLRILKETVTVKLNLEIACEAEVCEIALATRPDQVCLVPEKRQEITTEGGLDVAGALASVTSLCERFAAAGIDVSLFIDPDEEQIVAAAKSGAQSVELHTGGYATASGGDQAELDRLIQASKLVREAGLILHAGHGLNYQNVGPVAAIDEMQELNIGHSIIARSVFIGLEKAVRQMKELISTGLPPTRRF
ncbi:MAG: pyridoxine 5'-phosphate synthase [Pirellulaceae bacterium]|nr:pyridoxine 5'-phosphate synthase [Pirellulaceae bacterium]